MGNILGKLLVGVAITAVGMLGADNSLGIWKRNVTKTTARTQNTKSETVVREEVEGGVKQTTTRERADGTKSIFSYTAKYDGKEHTVTNAPFDTISIKQIDANTFIETRKTGGVLHATGRVAISKDGKTMTVTTEGFDPQGKSDIGTYVYDKQ
jgi:glucose/arabinose dehydrogenase